MTFWGTSGNDMDTNSIGGEGRRTLAKGDLLQWKDTAQSRILSRGSICFISDSFYNNERHSRLVSALTSSTVAVDKTSRLGCSHFKHSLTERQVTAFRASSPRPTPRRHTDAQCSPWRVARSIEDCLVSRARIRQILREINTLSAVSQ